MNYSKIIDEIQKIRAKNNENWMSILKIAFKYAPDEAKKIFEQIAKCDSEINHLSKHLGESSK